MEENNELSSSMTPEPDGEGQQPPSVQELLEQFVQTQQWDTAVESIDDGSGFRVEETILVHNQYYVIRLEGDESRNLFRLRIRPPYRVMEGKFVDACMLCNFINERYRYYGRLSVSEETGVINYRDFVEYGSSAPSMEILRNMADCGVIFFDEYQKVIAEVALTRKTYESIVREMSEEEENRNREDEQSEESDNLLS